MFARVTWSKLSQQTSIDAAVTNYREQILPSLQTQEGFLGVVVLANPETLEGVSATYWQTAEALAASEAMATAGRAQAAQATGVEIREVDRFEMIFQDRAGPVKVGTFVRANDVKASTAQIDATVAFLRDTAIPAAKPLGGYRATLVFANRDSGRMLVSTVWDTAGDRQASEATMGGLRRQAADLSQAQAGVQVSLYESVLVEVSPAAQQAARAAASAA